MAFPTTVCRSCSAEIVWQDTDDGRRPFNADGRSHFETCTERRGQRRNGSSSVPTMKDRTITRLAVLKAAATFLGALSQTHEEVKSEHVLKLADRWLAWVDQ
jgi:hypothetical protein